MGRKRKQISSPNSKKHPLTKKTTNWPTIQSLFKKTTEDSATELNDDCELILNQANLCGETDLDTIIDLIDEWVTTEEELLDEDVSYICKFFIDLSNEKNKFKIKQIVDHFYESIAKRKTANEEWRSMYNDTIGLISSEFEDLNFDFF